MPTPVWDHPFFKYVVRESFNRADTVASTAGTVILLIVAHFVVGGGNMLPADDFTRSIQIALAGFISIWLAIMIFRAFWWPFHWRLEPHGGLLSFLRSKLGTFMWPTILIVSGFAGFIALSGSGMIWLSLQVLRGASAEKTVASPNTVGNPDFSLSVPVERYRFTWPAAHSMQFYVRLDTERNPQIWNSPAFVLRNSTNTIAYRVAATWKSETSINLQDVVQASPKLSKATFRISDVEMDIIWTDKMPRILANFIYYLADAPKQVISVVAKEEEVYLPQQLWPIVAVYLIDKMPDEIGQTSPPFIARVTLEWETSEGKRRKPYRVRITATNAKSSNSDDPIVDAFLNFTLEEIPQ
jgi:hypothetical protein